MFSFLNENDEDQALFQDGYKVSVWTFLSEDATGE